MDYIKRKLGITKPVFILSFVSFLNDIASEMLYPVIPIFLLTVVGAPITVVGLIEGAAEATSSFFRVVTGFYSDKTQKRKPFVVAGYMLSTLAKPFFIVATFTRSWHTVFFGRFSDRLGKGVRTSARDALITENSLEENRAKVFSFHRGMDTLGAVVGPLIALWLLNSYPNDFKRVFILSAIPSVIAVLLLMFYIREQKRETTIQTSKRVAIKHLDKRFFLFIAVTALFAVGNSSDSFLILKANSLGITLTMTILAYVSYNISYSLLSVPAGIIADLLGKKKVMAFGFLIFSVVYFSFGIVQNPQLLWVLFPLYGVYMAFTDGVGKAYISSIVPEDHLATAFGLHQMVVGLCAFFASLIAGILWKEIGPSAPFFFGATMALLALLCFIFSWRFLHKPVEVTG